MGHLIIRNRNTVVLAAAVAVQIVLDEISAGCRHDDLCGAAFEELSDSANMVVVAMRDGNIVLSISAWVEWFSIIGLNGVVLQIVSEIDVLI